MFVPDVINADVALLKPVLKKNEGHIPLLQKVVVDYIGFVEHWPPSSRLWKKCVYTKTLACKSQCFTARKFQNTNTHGDFRPLFVL